MSDPNNINAAQQYRVAPAERGRFWNVDRDYLTTLGYPTSGEGKYAVLTYQINAVPLTLSGDINVGAVEIKDGTGATKVNVVDFGTYAGMASFLIDGAGNPITEFGQNAIKAPDAVAGTKIIQIGGIAVSGSQTAVSDGDAVALWLDEYGRPIIYGANLSEGSIDVTVKNNPILDRLGPSGSLVGATSAVNGTAIDVSSYHNYTIHITSSSLVSGGNVVEVQSSLNGTNYATIATLTFDSNETQEVAVSNQAYVYLRTSITTYVDGTFNSLIYCGN